MALFRKRKRKELKKGRARRVAADSDDGSNDDTASGVHSGSAGPSVTAAASSAQSGGDGNPQTKVSKIDNTAAEAAGDAHAGVDTAAEKKDKKSKKSKKKKKRDGNSIKPRLSIGFEFESEGATEAGAERPFSIKKSKASRHLARQLKRGNVSGFGLNPDVKSISISTTDASPTDAASRASAYSADALRELREQQKSMNEKSLRVLEESRQDEDLHAPGGPRIVVVGANAAGTGTSRSGENAAQAEQDDDDDPLFDREQVERVKRDKALRRAALVGDYIPLGGDQDGPRALRVRDLKPSFLDDDDGNRRLHSEAARGSAAATSVDGQSAEAEWELQQIRRATGSATHRDSTPQRGEGSQKNGVGLQTPSSAASRSGRRPRRFLGVGEVRSLLQKQIAELEHYEQQDDAKAARLEETIEAMEADLTKLEAQVQRDSAEYTLVQEMHDYLRNLCACVKDKRGKISDLCDAIHRARARVTNDRASAVADTQATLLRALQQQGVTLDVGGPPLPKVDSAGEGVDEFGRDMGSVQSQRDERLLQKWAEHSGPRDAVQRWWDVEGLSSKTSTTDAINHLSEAELELLSQIVAGGQNTLHSKLRAGDEECEQRVNELLALRPRVVEDAAHEFYEFQPILAAFHRWRVADPKTYADTFAELGLAQILAPYAQMQMAGWNPLGVGTGRSKDGDDDGRRLLENSQTVGGFAWIRDVEAHVEEVRDEEGLAALPTSFGDGHHDAKDNGRAGGNLKSTGGGGAAAAGAGSKPRLLADVLERAVVPLLVPALTEVWDPAEVSQAKSLAVAIRELQARGISNKALGKLKDAAARRAQDYLRTFRLPSPTDTSRARGDLRDLARIFFAQSFAVSVAVLANFGRVHDVLPSAAMRSSVWSGLVSRQVTFLSRVLSDTHARADSAFARARSDSRDDAADDEDDEAFSALEAAVRCARCWLRALPSSWVEQRALLAGLFVNRGHVLPAMRPLVAGLSEFTSVLKKMASSRVYVARQGRKGCEFPGLQRDVARLSFFLSQETGGASI